MMGWGSNNPQICQVCGDLMPCAVLRTAEVDGKRYPVGYMCEECYGEKENRRTGSNMGGAAESTDIAYHGGLFNRGEW